MLLLLLLLLAAKILLTSLDLSLHLQHNDMVGGGRGLSKVKDKKVNQLLCKILKDKVSPTVIAPGSTYACHGIWIQISYLKIRIDCRALTQRLNRKLMINFSSGKRERRKRIRITRKKVSGHDLIHKHVLRTYLLVRENNSHDYCHDCILLYIRNSDLARSTCR